MVRAPIDRESGAGDRAGAERIAVRARVRRLEPHRVALELLDDGEQVVRDGARLRRLGMRMGGEDGLQVAAREIEQHMAQPQRRFQHRQNQLPLLHPIHRHVDVVAGARGVQPPGDVLSARS